MISMNSDIAEVLFNENKIQDRIRELAKMITTEYQDKNPVMIGILKGGFVFMAGICSGERKRDFQLSQTVFQHMADDVAQRLGGGPDFGADDFEPTGHQ